MGDAAASTRSRHVTSVVPMEADFAIGVFDGYSATPPNVFGFGIGTCLPKILTDNHFRVRLDTPDTRLCRMVRQAGGATRSSAGLGCPSARWCSVGDCKQSGTQSLLQAVNMEFAADQLGVADKIKAHGLKGGALEDVLIAKRELTEVRHELFRAASERGVPGEALVDFMIAEPAGVLRRGASGHHFVHSMYMQHARRARRIGSQTICTTLLLSASRFRTAMP